MSKFTSMFMQHRVQVLIDQAIFSGSSFLTTLLLARTLEPTLFGTYASVAVFAFLAVCVTNALVIQPLQVTVAGIADKRSYIAFGFWLQLILVIIIAMAIVLVFQFGAAYLTTYNGLTACTILFIAGFLLHDYFRKLFLATAAVRKALTIDVIAAVAQFAVLLASVFIHCTLPVLLTLQGLAYLPALIYGLTQIGFKLPDSQEIRTYWGLHYRQGKWLLLSAVVQWWAGNLFLLASGVFLGIEALGALRLVQSLFGVLNVVLQTFENYTLPQASKLMLHSHAEARTYLKQMGKKTLLGFGLMLLFIFIFAEPIIALAGGVAYARYADVVRGMSILYFIIFVGYPIRLAIRALVLNQYIFMGYVLSLLFSLISFDFLLSTFQLPGAIAGLLLSQIVVLGFWQYILVKKNFSLWK